MKTMKFKTDIKCSGCVAKVTPHLNEAIGAGNWEVDLVSPSRILTVAADASEVQIEAAVKKAGYKAEKM